MTGFTFPSNPNIGDTYVLGTRTYAWNGISWAIQTQNSSVITVLTATGVVSFTTSTQSTGTSTGGLIVVGGVGVGGSINVGNTSTVLGAEIITTATLNKYVLKPIFVAGTGTAITTSTDGVNETVTIWNTATLQIVTNQGSTTTNVITIQNSSTASGVGTGALIVTGGASIGGDLWLGGTIYSAGVPVITTSSLGQAIYAGTDIYISSTGSSGILVINDISTLQTVTERGSTTTNTVNFANTVTFTSTATSINSGTGAVVIAGGLGVGGRINSESVQIADAIFDSGLVLVNTTDTVVVDRYSINDFRSSKYLIQIDEGSGPSASFEVIEILLLVDNAGTVYATEYAVVTSSGELGEFAADVQGDNLVRLYFTAYQASNKVIKILRTAMTV